MIGFPTMTKHLRENLPAYIFGVLGSLAIYIGHDWLQEQSERINRSLCALVRTNVAQQMDRLRSMIIESPTDHLSETHPSIKYSELIEDLSSEYGQDCPKVIEEVGNAAFYRKLIALWSGRDYSRMIRVIEDHNDHDYLTIYFKGAAYNGISSLAADDSSKKHNRIRASQTFKDAYNRANTEYKGFLSYKVLTKMECMSLINENDVDKTLDCFKKLQQVTDNSATTYNIACAYAAKGEIGAALETFEQYARTVPHDRCRAEEIKGHVCWEEILGSPALRSSFETILDQFPC